MPRYKLKRQGHLIIVENFRIVNTSKCERINHEILFNTNGHIYVESIARNKMIEEFMDCMNGKEYIPDGPTVYCMDCQDDCKYKGMEG